MVWKKAEDKQAWAGRSSRGMAAWQVHSELHQVQLSPLIRSLKQYKSIPCVAAAAGQHNQDLLLAAGAKMPSHSLKCNMEMCSILQVAVISSGFLLPICWSHYWEQATKVSFSCNGIPQAVCSPLPPLPSEYGQNMVIATFYQWRWLLQLTQLLWLLFFQLVAFPTHDLASQNTNGVLLGAAAWLGQAAESSRAEFYPFCQTAKGSPNF